MSSPHRSRNTLTGYRRDCLVVFESPTLERRRREDEDVQSSVCTESDPVLGLQLSRPRKISETLRDQEHEGRRSGGLKEPRTGEGERGLGSNLVEGQGERLTLRGPREDTPGAPRSPGDRLGPVCGRGV